MADKYEKVCREVRGMGVSALQEMKVELCSDYKKN